MEPGFIDEIRQSTNGNYVLGNERFKEDIANMLNDGFHLEKLVGPLKKV